MLITGSDSHDPAVEASRSPERRVNGRPRRIDEPHHFVVSVLIFVASIQEPRARPLYRPAPLDALAGLEPGETQGISPARSGCSPEQNRVGAALCEKAIATGQLFRGGSQLADATWYSDPSSGNY